MSDQAFEGSCFCGQVAWTATGQPVRMGYCHCPSCRSWSASPINAFTLWKTENFSITKGADLIQSFNKTPGSTRKWCNNCGGHIATEHPGPGLVDLFAASLPSFPFAAELHIHYKSTVMPIKDGLPKMKDVPAEMGGSGKTLDE